MDKMVVEERCCLVVGFISGTYNSLTLNGKWMELGLTKLGKNVQTRVACVEYAWIGSKLGTLKQVCASEMHLLQIFALAYFNLDSAKLAALGVRV